MSGCCSERGCTRKQPFLILQSPLSKRYYVVAEYEEIATADPSYYNVRRKHDITEQIEALLQREREAKSEAGHDTD